MIFDKKEIETQITHLKDATHFSLNSLKKDVLHTFEWIKYMQGRHNELERYFQHVHKMLEHVSESHNAFRDRHELIGELMQRISTLERKLERYEKRGPVQVHTPVDKPLIEEPKSTVPVPAHGPKSKEEALQIILDMVRKHQPIPNTALRDTLIRQNVCSKSSYYRFIVELEEAGKITARTEDRTKILRIPSED